MISLLFIALLISTASAGLFSRKDRCLEATFSTATDCAILYDHHGCRGWSEPITKGYTTLSYWHKNDAGAVVVRKGCTLVGYDHADANVDNRGATVTIVATDKDLAKQLEGKPELENRISAVDCSCGNNNNSNNNNNNIKKRSGNSGPNCDRVEFGNNACIVYDDADCKVEHWDAPLFFVGNNSRSFSLLDASKNYKFRNAIESVSVRKGCSLEVFTDARFDGDSHLFVAPKEEDLHDTLERDGNTKSFNDNIESLKCNCS